MVHKAWKIMIQDIVGETASNWKIESAKLFPI